MCGGGANKLLYFLWLPNKMKPFMEVKRWRTTLASPSAHSAVVIQMYSYRLDAVVTYTMS